VFEKPLDTVGQVTAQLHVHDGDLYQHLQRRGVEFFERELDAGILARRGEDQQRIAVGHRHDPDLIFAAAGSTLSPSSPLSDTNVSSATIGSASPSLGSRLNVTG
jgi:hypothetical protein